MTSLHFSPTRYFQSLAGLFCVFPSLLLLLVASLAAGIRSGSLLYAEEVGTLAFIVGKHLQPRGFTQFEFVGIPRAAGTKQSLPFGRAGDILDMRAVAIAERAFLHEILGVAVRAFDVKACRGHQMRSNPGLFVASVRGPENTVCMVSNNSVSGLND